MKSNKLKTFLNKINPFKKKPKSWRDIKLYQAQELLQLDLDGIDLLIAQMSIVMDKDEAYIETLPLEAILKFAEEYSFLSQTPKEKLIKLFKIGKKRYGMVELNKLTLAQIIDIEEYWNDGWIKNMNKILSVLFLPVKKYNPITKKYVLEEYRPNPELEVELLDMNMEVIFSNLLFFYHTEQLYLKGMKVYLEGQMKKQTTNISLLRKL